MDPYFSATKIAWLLEHVDGLRARAERGEIAFGTVDSWLIWNLTGGARHVTDMTNASRTLLFDIHRLRWSDELLELFGVPRAVLPEVLPCTAAFGTARAERLGAAIPIAGVAGDQQAALIGQAGFAPGIAKNTYGTGSFVVLNTGEHAVRSEHGLLATVAFAFERSHATYALEGSIFVTGAAVQWLRDGLGIIAHAAEVEALAREVEDSGECVFVPAFTGLGAPYWDPYARGTILGITRGTTRAHLARAALDAIACSTARRRRSDAAGCGRHAARAARRRRRVGERAADAAAGRRRSACPSCARRASRRRPSARRRSPGCSAASGPTSMRSRRSGAPTHATCRRSARPLATHGSRAGGARSLRRADDAPRHAARALAAALLFAAAGCGGGGSSAVAPPPPPATPPPNGHIDWPAYAYDATRSGKNPNETIVGRGNAGSLKLRWSFATSGAVVAQPVLAANVAVGGGVADVLYVGDESGTFYALNAASGAPVWNASFGTSGNSCGDLPSWGITSTAVIDRAQHGVFVADGAGNVHGLDLATGKPLATWPSAVFVLRNPSDEYVYSALALSPSGTLYVANASYCDTEPYQGAVVALDDRTAMKTATWIPQTPPNDGNGIWGAGGVAADPRGNGDLYVATGNAFPESAPLQRQRRAAQRRAAAASAPRASSPRRSTTTTSARLPSRFRRRAARRSSSSSRSPGILYLFDLDALASGPVQALAIGTPTDQGLNVNTAAYDAASQMVYVPNGTANAPYVQGLLAFSAATCRLTPAWQRSGAGASPLSSPSVANGVVYYATGSGANVAAYDAASGVPLWTSPPFGGPSYSPPAVVNGFVYATSFDRHVYAFAP